MKLVYFIYSAGLLKIGCTKDIERRMADLGNMGAAPSTLIAVLPGDKSLEYRLHCLFKDDRRHGEWFYPSDEMKRFLYCIDVAAKVTMTPGALFPGPAKGIGSCVERLAYAMLASGNQ